MCNDLHIIVFVVENTASGHHSNRLPAPGHMTHTHTHKHMHKQQSEAPQRTAMKAMAKARWGQRKGKVKRLGPQPQNDWKEMGIERAQRTNRKKILFTRETGDIFRVVSGRSVR